MNWPSSWSSENWIVPGLSLLIIGLSVTLWSNFRTRMDGSVRLASVGLKSLGLLMLVVCLFEPLRMEEIPKLSANIVVALVDQSRSLQIKESVSDQQTREQKLKEVLESTSTWQAELESKYDFRRAVFDSGVRPVNVFKDMAANGEASNLSHAIETLKERYGSKPCAGYLVFTDGNATDLGDYDFVSNSKIPIYPVVLGGEVGRDISISNVSVSQTNFESAPVAISVEMKTSGYSGKSIVVQLLDEHHQELSREKVAQAKDGKRFAVRFEVKPEKAGTHFYSVRVFESAAEKQFSMPDSTLEATLINNQKMIAVDRGHGPYRILFVSGRPNWELKFLQRALAEDEEVELISMIRVAKREPKFSFRSAKGEDTNPLFRGFGNENDEQAEQFDEAVLLTLPVENDLAKQLRRGFPRKAEDLFQFDAIIIDDVESDFFSPDQHALIEEFVSERGGSLMMLGGQETFVKGNYQRTPIGNLLPVYLDRQRFPIVSGKDYRLDLTRDGWLQPWVRVRSTEPLEQRRLQTMPSFQTLNLIGSIKPGANVLANVRTADDQIYPALVVQRFGKGRTASLMIGDFWTWHLKGENDDLMKAWRQTARWLVADVPRRFDVKIDQESATEMAARIELRDASFQPLDNCRVVAKITPAVKSTQDQLPTGEEKSETESQSVELLATPDDQAAGVYHLKFTPRTEGAFRIAFSASSSDGKDLGRLDSGWVSQPATEEFKTLSPNREFLERIAGASGGKVIDIHQLDEFCKKLPNNQSMITETKVFPWWHNWTVLAGSIACFVIEWGIRRWKGLP